MYLIQNRINLHISVILLGRVTIQTLIWTVVFSGSSSLTLKINATGTICFSFSYSWTLQINSSYWVNFGRSQCYPLRISGWPLELMAYAYLAVSPPSMNKQFEEVP